MGAALRMRAGTASTPPGPFPPPSPTPIPTRAGQPGPRRPHPAGGPLPARPLEGSRLCGRRAVLQRHRPQEGARLWLKLMNLSPTLQRLEVALTKVACVPGGGDASSCTFAACNGGQLWAAGAACDVTGTERRRRESGGSDRRLARASADGIAPKAQAPAWLPPAPPHSLWAPWRHTAQRRW